MLYIARNALTRDDVYYTKNPPPCEVVETRKGYPPPIRKFVTINQKYAYAPELLEALQGDTAGPEDDEKDKKKKEPKPEKSEDDGEGVDLKALAAHSAVSAVALGLALYQYALV